MKKIIYYVYGIILILAVSCNDDMIQDGVDSSQDPRVPEINIKLISDSIPSGGSTEEITGVKAGSSKEIVFTIENRGTVDLELYGSPVVTVSGADADEFPQAEIVQPASVIPGGQSEPFTVVFTPDSPELKTAILTVQSNDADESIYSFTVKARSRPVPDFSARLRKAGSPVSVSFEDRSLPVGEIISWKWDFNGDGIIDSYEQNPTHVYADPGYYTVVLEVEGAGSSDFRIKSNYIHVLSPVKHTITENFKEAMWVDCADVDSDSDIDIMAGSGSNNELAWWDNVDIDGSGTGNATEWQKYSINNRVALPLDFRSIQAADFDKDGNVDIAGLGYNYGYQLYLFINNGTSYWNESGSLVSGYSNPICIADLDTDTELDILVSSPPKWLENDGGENFTVNDLDLWPFFTSQSIKEWYSADLDKDSDMDIIGCYSNGLFPARYYIYWWENDGSQSFTNDHLLAGGADYPYSLNIADLDGDGNKDIIVSDQSTGSIYWWENDGDMNLTVNQIDSGMNGQQYVLNTDDIENDGDLDIIGAGYDSNEILWWENDGNQNFTRHIIDTEFNGAISVSSADINADGVMEIVGTASNDDEIAWWEIQLSEWYENPVDGLFSGAFDVFAFDMDNDGDKDIIGAGDNGITWWEYNDGNIVGTHVIVSDDAVASVFPVDIDNDTDIDILYATDSEIICSLNSDGTGVNWEEKIIDDAFYSAIVYAVELDGDNFIDIVAVNTGDIQDFKWWKHIDGLCNFNNGEDIAVTNCGDEAGSLFSVDINKDGFNDLIVSGVTDGDIVWLKNDGNAGLTQYSVDAENNYESGFSVYSEDIDNDGDFDVLCGAVFYDGSNYPVVVWWENSSGSTGINWTEHVIDDSIDDAYSVFSDDIDDDGDMDVLAALPGDSVEKNGQIIIWFNDGEQNFSKEIIKEDYYGVRALKVADIDNDDDPDIITAADYPNDITWWENNILDYGP